MKAHLILALVLIAIVAYHMPWHSHKVAAFSNNAFDLAEMMSLHPQVHAESPRLYTSLLLRIPLIFLAMLVVLIAGQLRLWYWRWGWYGVALLIVLRLNPPFVFYPYGGGSWNDRQLGDLMLIGIGTVGVLVVGNRWLKSLARPLVIGLMVVTLYSALAGYQRATQLVDNQLGLDVKLGGGLVLFVVSILSITAISLSEYRLEFRPSHHKNRHQPTPHHGF